MFGPPLGLLLIGAEVGLHLDQAAGLPLEEAIRVVERAGDSIARWTGRKAILNDSVWFDCEARDRCVTEIAERTGTPDLVLFEIYGGPTKIRLIAERVAAPSSSATHRAETNLSRAQAPWSDELSRIAELLFPEGRSTPATSLPMARTEERPTMSPYLPAITLGAAAVATGLAVTFAFEAKGARDEIAERVLFDDEFERVSAMRHDFTVASRVCIGVAAGSLIASAVLFLIE